MLKELSKKQKLLQYLTCRGVNLGIYGTNLAREIGQSQTGKAANFTIHFSSPLPQSSFFEIMDSEIGRFASLALADFTR